MDHDTPRGEGKASCLVVGLVLMLFLVSECGAGGGGGGSSTPPDPVGTVTTTLRTPGQGNTSIRFRTGSTTAPPFDLTLDTNLNFLGTIAGVGGVSGVGAITTVPSSGFVAAMTATTGNGYVVKTADGFGLYYAVYVDHAVTSAIDNGVIGLTIKWRSLTSLSSITIMPPNSSVTRPNLSCNTTTLQFHATGTNSDNSTPDLTNLVTWSASSNLRGNPFITSSGLVTVVGPPPPGGPNGPSFVVCVPTSSSLGTVSITATDAITGIVGSTPLTIQ